MKRYYLTIFLGTFLLFDLTILLLLKPSQAIPISKQFSILSPPSTSPQPDKNLSFAEGSIKVIEGKIYLNETLQNDLNLQIDEAKKELIRLQEMLALNFTEDLGFVYFHQGQNRWRLRFTFGGLLLKTSAKIYLSTEQIFSLKSVFDKTDRIEVKGIKYKTTGIMRQLGPILHEDES